MSALTWNLDTEIKLGDPSRPISKCEERSDAKETVFAPSQLCLMSQHTDVIGLPHRSPDVSTVVCRPGTFETKFLMTPEQGDDLRHWARRHLQLDAYSRPELQDGYQVNSLYLDTSQFDVYRRQPGFRERKYRLRRYGLESTLWLEMKKKTAGIVTKRRVSLFQNELEGGVFHVQTNPSPGWLQQRIVRSRMQPVCQVTYNRSAYVGSSSTGPIRMTLDSQLRCSRTRDWIVPAQSPTDGMPLTTMIILELKYCVQLPAVFVGLIQTFQLTGATFSKYRQSVEACVPRNEIYENSN